MNTASKYFEFPTAITPKYILEEKTQRIIQVNDLFLQYLIDIGSNINYQESLWWVTLRAASFNLKLMEKHVLINSFLISNQDVEECDETFVLTALSRIADKSGYEVTISLQKENIVLCNNHPSDVLWWLNSMGFVYPKRLCKIKRKMIFGLTRKPQPFINI